ncbi:MAG: hypothetical protein ACW9WZ_04675 [Nitrosopumilus sp.]|jgi:hypothetical protein
MISDSKIQKSLEQYITNRIKEIKYDNYESIQRIKKIWKCENGLDFVYGYYVGKIEEGSYRFLLKYTRSEQTEKFDSEGIREIIEMHKQELLGVIKINFNE